MSNGQLGIGGVNGKGYLQVRLGNEWGTAHWEWIPINTSKMLTGTEYTLELHVEGNVALANDWRNHLQKKAILLPKDASLGKNCTKTVLQYKIRTDKPIAQMKEAELKDLLKSIYLKELNYLCNMLVNKFGGVSDSLQEELFLRAQKTIERAKNNPKGSLREFIEKCKSSARLEKDGLAKP